MQFAVCLTAIAVLALAVSATNELNFDHGSQIKFVNVIYNQNYATTTYVYNVTTGNTPISHYTIGRTDDCDGAELTEESLQEWEDFGLDAVTGVTGYRRKLGMHANSFEQHRLTFKHAAYWSFEVVPIGIRTQAGSTATLIDGPQCLTSPRSYPNVASFPPATLHLDCTDPAQADPVDDPHFVGSRVVKAECEQDYVKKRHFLWEDRERQVTFTQTVIVRDESAPEFNMQHNISVEIQCGQALPPMPEVNVTDNCDSDVEVKLCEETLNNTICPSNYFITRTWTAIDDCGNSRCFTQTISVVDTLKPALLGVPEDQTLECPASFDSVEGVTVDDHGCDCLKSIGNTEQYGPFIHFEEERIEGDCPNTYVLKRTWKAEDCCGNKAREIRYFTVEDTTAPTIYFVNPDTEDSITVDCDHIPAPPRVAANDSCDAHVQIHLDTTEVHSAQCYSNYVIRRVWTATDDCGNSVELVQIVNVQDRTPPHFHHVPRHLEVECTSELPARQDPTAEDACGNATVSFIGEFTTPSDCPNDYVITRWWQAVDDCGNSKNVSQTIHVFDHTAPQIVLSSLPSSKNVSCAADAVFDVTDVIATTPEPACEDDITITYTDVTHPNGCPNRFTLVRTWTAVDCSLNSDHESRSIIVNDDVAPTLSCDSNDCGHITLECGQWPNTAPTVSASDNCDCGDACIVEPTVDEPADSCYKVVTRTWTTQDACFNTASLEQRIVVQDTTAPQWTEDLPPHTRTVQCDDLPTDDLESYACNDTCNGCESSFDSFRTDGFCEQTYTITKVWTIKDACGNNQTHTSVINVVDTTAPWLNIPADATVECDKVPAKGEIEYGDNCDSNVTISYNEEPGSEQPTDCADHRIIVRIWTASDDCGNSVTKTQHITVVDTTAPVWSDAQNGLPQLTFECAQGSIDVPSVSDNCDLSVNINSSHVDVHQGSASCGDYISTITWTATDNCGNSASISQIVVVHDSQAPTLTAPAPATKECSDDLNPEVIYGLDACDGSVAATLEEPVITPGQCANDYVITFTWNATDNCGNSVQASTTLTVEDTTAPELSGLPDAEITVNCSAIPPIDGYTVVAQDNCALNLEVKIDDATEDGPCDNQYTLYRTFSADDGCGNNASFTQTIHVVDQIFPIVTIDGAADVTVECDQVPTPADASYTDNCGTPETGYGQESAAGSCADDYVLTRTWWAADACGNNATHVQTITVQDTTAPVWPSGYDSEEIVECSDFDDQWPAQPGTPTDNCDRDVHIDTNVIIVPSETCPQNKDVIYQWIATDNCGNVAVRNYTVHVLDTKPPTAIFEPCLKDVEVPCHAPELPHITLEDNCDLTPHIELNETVESTDCIYRETRLRVWTVTDDCGNSRNYFQRITVTHDKAPTLSATPANLTVECDYLEPADDVTATGECESNVYVDFTEEPIGTGCENTYTLIRTWTATDACGLTTSHVQSVSVIDTTPPTFDTVPPAVIDRTELFCGERWKPDNLTATDSCNNQSYPAIATVGYVEVCKYRFDAHVYWTAWDCQGNSVTHESLYVFRPANTQPTINPKPSSTNVDCSEIPSKPELTGTDICGDEIELIYEEEHNGDDCNYELTRCWHGYDNCTEVAWYCYDIRVTDTHAPELSGVPSDKSVECGFVPPRANVTAVDDCNHGAHVEFDEETVQNDPDNCCNLTITRKWRGYDDCGNFGPWHYQVIKVSHTIPPILMGVPPDATAECDNVPGPANVTGMSAPLAVGWCVEADTTPSNALVATCNADAHFPAATSTGSLSTTFDFVTGVDGTSSVIMVYATGTAAVRGDLVSAGGQTCHLEIDLADEKAWTTKTLDYSHPLNDQCYTTSANPIANAANPTGWRFYQSGSGLLQCGTDTYALTLSTSVAGQVGFGAHNGDADKLGATILLNYEGGAFALRFQYHTCELNEDTWPALRCRDHVTVNVTTTFIDGNCTDNYTVIYTYTAHDIYEQTVTAVQTIHVADNEPPTLIGVPAAETAQCDRVPPIAIVTATDNCDDSVNVSSSQSELSRAGQGCYVLERTWAAQDDCGNAAIATQLVTVVDETAPVLVGVPADRTGANAVQCNRVPPQAVVTATDNCDTVAVVPSHRIVPNGCPGYFRVVYTWTAKDSCNNTVSASQNIDVVDTEAPVITGVPANITIECGADLPAPANPTATDNCDAPFAPAFTQDAPVSTSACNKYIKRTWTATDSCGNSVSRSQFIIIQDTQRPNFVAPLPPASVTVQCDNVPETPTLAAFDACDGALTVPPPRVTTVGNGCGNNYTITRVWTATDACGRTRSFTQRVKVIDTQAPILLGVPADTTNDCKHIDPIPPVCVQENCPSSTLSYSEVIVPGSCPSQYQIIRTWTATDDCGLVTTKSYTITVRDNTAPTFVGLPADSTQECGAVTFPANPTATDDCNTATVTAVPPVQVGSGCNFKWKLDYIATDLCGNRATATVWITVQDTKAPVIGAIPANAQVECGQVPNGLPVPANDQCQGLLSASPSDVTVPSGICPASYTIQRTWTASDSCGNSASKGPQTITVRDTTNPYWTSLPAREVHLQCGAELPDQSASGDDACSTVSVTMTPRTEPGHCANALTVIRTWTLRDACGNQISNDTYIYVDDSTAPELIGLPANQSASCASVPAWPTVTARDNCDHSVEVTFTDSSEPGDCDNATTLYRTWTASDDCGNTVTATRQIVVTDTTNPYWTSPRPESPRVFECPAWEEPADQTAGDSCDHDVEVTRSEQTIGLSDLPECDNHKVIYTFTAEDNCGNSIEREVVHISRDSVKPYFTGVPAAITVECDHIPESEAPTPHDDCKLDNSSLSYTSSESQHGDCQNYVITRTWSVSDACGNSNSAVQLVTVQDSTYPTFDNSASLPADITVECGHVPAHDNLTASDNCGDAEVSYSDSTAEGPQGCTASIIITRVWTATDACGHAIQHVQKVTVQDTGAPIITDVPADAQYNCSAPQAPEVTVEDLCSTFYVNFTEVPQNTDCEYTYTLERTWTATDACGNVATASQTVTVSENQAPTFDQDTPADMTLECTEEVPEYVLTAHGQCGPAEVTLTNSTEQGGCAANYTIHRAWNASSECGLTTSTQQTITVQDTQPPICEDLGKKCIIRVTADGTYIYSDVTVSGEFFTCYDACSNVTVTITRCSSNQDAWAASTFSPPESYYTDAEHHFNQHCQYDAATDKLTVSLVINPLEPAGRFYTVYGQAEDECGHITEVQRTIWVPRDANSTNIVNPGPNDEACVPQPIECNDICPCEYHSLPCHAQTTAWSFALTDSQQSGVNTLLTYTLSAPSTSAALLSSPVPLRVTLGVDLTKVQVLQTSPSSSVTFGFHYDSFVAGIHWPVLLDVSSLAPGQTFTFTVTLAGVYDANQYFDLPVILGGGDQLTNDNPCSGELTAKGPKAAPQYTGLSFDGVVNLDGILTDVNTHGVVDVGMRDVIVLLLDGIHIAALKMTDEHGAFHFRGMPAATSSYSLKIDADGFFRASDSLPASYFSGALGDFTNTNPYGNPKPALQAPAVNKLNVYLNLPALLGPPVYFTRNADSFLGNPHPITYWAHQLESEANSYGSLSKRKLLIDAYVTVFSGSSSFCAPSSSILDELTSGTPLAKCYYAMGLNHAAGHGLFNPYRPLQRVLVDYVGAAYCANSALVEGSATAICNILIKAH